MTHSIVDADLKLLPQNRHLMCLMDYKEMAATEVFYHKVSLSEGQNPIAR